jgi:hypothetical protein
VRCYPRGTGFFCGFVFVSEKMKSETIDALDLDTGERYKLISPQHGYYQDYLVLIEK